ncbi:serine protease [Burkholderia sp. Ac-20365]|uniref:trypsin-like serine peptidase n=1 Tax=Burkholderia sp. Ac-20365 TaxID=2703897 RepID=UPI00197C6C40|nr:serine protease [Burkholderia sp. Ac-20365]MBN3760771.1 trypsin-like peptidase domain-containing protein [Burkholderia sp. Ac-20365]
MSSLFDEPQYPFHLSVARDLHLTLTRLYPTSKAAAFAADKAGIGAYRINTDQSPYMIWYEILTCAAPAGLTRGIVELAATEFPRSPSHDFLTALLDDRRPRVQPEPRDSDGKPRFRHGSDDVSEPEALLFHDDLTLRSGQLKPLIAALERVHALMPAVCRLEVTIALGEARGTAFRIGPDLLLTNCHVLRPEGLDPVAVTATFGYEDDAAGTGLDGRAIACLPASIIADGADDWGVIRVAAPIPDGVPTLRLDHGVIARSGLGAFIVQHPNGQRKRIAYARNQITYCDDQVVQYLSDTEEGSSGSPVLDPDGNVIALHRAGGRPQEVAGQAALTKNEGIAIARVLRGIVAKGIEL